MSLKNELKTLLSSLHTLGTELPHALISLTQVVQPMIDDRLRIPFLQTMFSELPTILENSSEQDLALLVANPPQEAVALRLLLDLRQVAQILIRLTYYQILVLAQHIPPGQPQNQLNHIIKLQDHFQGWSLASLRNCVETISRTPLHLERQTLFKLEPTLPQEISHLVIQIIKIPQDEAESFKIWIDACSQNELILLVNLLQMEINSLVDIKLRLSTSDADKQQPKPGEKRKRTDEVPTNLRNTSKFTTYSTDKQISMPLSMESNENDFFESFFNTDSSEYNFSTDWNQPPSQVDNSVTQKPVTPVVNSPESVSSPSTYHSPSVSSPPSKVEKPKKENPAPAVIDVIQVEPTNIPLPLHNPLNPQANATYQLRVSMQPPAQTVYQRILKPFPAVMLIGPHNESHDFFVEASLVRIDTNSELPMCLDGTRVSNIAPGHLASFKRLKILSTTQQQGTLFKLKFQLKRYQKGSFETIHGVHAVSIPIEVFSHTYYLQNRGRGRGNTAPPPPTVTEVLPSRGPASGGTRVVVLGTNFIESGNLLVKFGETVVRPQFHENKTLICTTLPGPPKSSVEVKVSNDGVEYCDTLAIFTYD